MRSTYTTHQSLADSARTAIDADRRARAIAEIIAARAAERQRQTRNARRAIIAVALIFVAGLIFIPAPIL